MDIMKEFATLKELEIFINDYQRRNLVQLWKRDARNIDTMRKICPNKLRFCNSDLKYYSITYSCSKGGRKFEPKGTGLRNSSTTKENCNMHIKLKLSADGQKLQIASINEDHNHNIETLQIRNIETKTFQPKHKKSVHASDKSSPLRDLEVKKSKRNLKFSTLENVFKYLNVHDNIVHIAVNDDNKLLGIYYQTQWMKKCFAAYPEFLIFQIIHKLNNLHMLVYLIMSVNGNNEGDPIAFFVINEDTDILCHMLQVFKEQNPKWPSLNVIVTDQDFGENSILQEAFPDASHQKCMFNVLNRFQINISVMDIKRDEKEKCFEIFKKIASAKNVQEYSQLYEELINLNIVDVGNYYNTNWHSIRQKWVKCYKHKNRRFGVTLTNHIELFSEKIKNTCNRSDDLMNFFENLNIILDNVQSVRNQTAESMQNHVANVNSTYEMSYMQALTPHAYKLVQKNLQNIPKFNITHHNTYFKLISQGFPKEEYTVDILTKACTCTFYTANYLLCPHMFAIKSFVKTDLFDETCVYRRHLKSKYINTFKKSPQKEAPTEPETFVNGKLTLTTEQKYKITITKCKQIASILANMNCAEFMQHSKQLDTLIEHWSLRRGTEICLRNAEDTEDNRIDCDTFVTEETQSDDKETLENIEELETTEIIEEIADTMDINADILLEVEREGVFETKNFTDGEIIENEREISKTIQNRNISLLSENEDKIFSKLRYPTFRKRREQQGQTALEMKKCKNI